MSSTDQRSEGGATGPKPEDRWGEGLPREGKKNPQKKTALTEGGKRENHANI